MIKKVYPDGNGLVIFVCPTCGDLRKEKAETYKQVMGPIKIPCRCGNTYEVQIEFRNSYRKETKLDGIYSTADSPDQWEEMVVMNLSIGGCGFETMITSLLKPGETIKVEFKLDDNKNSQIKETAVVRYVRECYVGCQFIRHSAVLDPDLGFYLRKK